MPWRYADMKYARHTVLMTTIPGGPGVRAENLTKAGLTIHRGTRLMPVKRHGDWVLVQSPSAELGWVPEHELTSQRPQDEDHFKLR